jgi:phage-related protein
MANQQPLRIPVLFYRTATGREPVLEWLRDLGPEDRRAIGRDLMRVQFGWPVGMPLVRSLKDGLWEVRSTLPSLRIARLMLCFHENKIVALHAFIKRTQRTPAQDIEVARQRMREVTS